MAPAKLIAFIASEPSHRRDSRSKSLSATGKAEGWTPVILHNGKWGYVQNRYAYLPLGNWTVSVTSGGKWQLRAFISGD